jgi:hypothetical protein
MPIARLELIVPTLRVGMHPWTLRVRFKTVTRSVTRGIPTRSVGTITQPTNPRTMKYSSEGPSKHPSPV